MKGSSSLCHLNKAFPLHTLDIFTTWNCSKIQKSCTPRSRSDHKHLVSNLFLHLLLLTSIHSRWVEIFKNYVTYSTGPKVHSTNITLPTKVCIVKAIVSPVVIYGCESWTIKKVECQRIDAFELCWRRLLRVP